MINTAAAKARLEAQLMELKERQDRIAQDLAQPLNPDFSEQAVQMENDIPLEGQAALISREIASVMRALTRIENGVYGQFVAEMKSQPSALRLGQRRRCALNARAKNSESGLGRPRTFTAHQARWH